MPKTHGIASIKLDVEIKQNNASETFYLRSQFVKQCFGNDFMQLGNKLFFDTHNSY